MYKLIVDYYKQMNKKKTTKKIFAFVVYNILKSSGELITHNKVSSILEIESKIVCKSLKEIGSFLHQELD